MAETISVKVTIYGDSEDEPDEAFNVEMPLVAFKALNAGARDFIYFDSQARRVLEKSESPYSLFLMSGSGDDKISGF